MYTLNTDLLSYIIIYYYYYYYYHLPPGPREWKPRADISVAMQIGVPVLHRVFITTQSECPSRDATRIHLRDSSLWAKQVLEWLVISKYLKSACI